MKRIALFSAFALFLLSAVSVSAQEKKYYTPQKGDWAIGVVFNPASMSSQMLAQPKPGEFVGKWISDNAASPHQMFMLSQDPVAAIRVKYRVSKKWAIRASVGLNGSIVNYREYVPDDMALALNPDSQNQVVDEIQSKMNSGSLMLGCELMCGTKTVRFIVGADLLYSIAGGHLLFNYGNKMTDLNRIPSSMPMTSEMKEGSVNDFTSRFGIAYGRPLDRYNSGYISAFGLSLDMGIEVFIAERISTGLTMSFTPVAVAFQPETYTVYEGFCSYTGKVENYTGYVSPGSNALLYGIENFGVRISMNYYF
ncbi:MAG TPA: hypothetical protein H9973_03620 [Candidatus Alistipes cottocaccae]|nr:hypothetical protein [Candidatus Alistipes cottocaccae]